MSLTIGVEVISRAACAGWTSMWCACLATAVSSLHSHEALLGVEALAPVALLLRDDNMWWLCYRGMPICELRPRKTLCERHVVSAAEGMRRGS
eukprot:363694-Chlamydomonas_euryale.AAC.2